MQALDHVLGNGAHRAGDQNHFSRKINLDHLIYPEELQLHYMIPYFSNAATALIPCSNAFLTSFSPRAFSSALVKTSSAASSGPTQIPSMSPKRKSPGRMRIAPISMAIRKSTTL